MSPLLAARHPYRAARAAGWLGRVDQALAAETEEKRLQYLQDSGLDAETFATLARGHRSAWALARRHFWTAEDEDTTRVAKAIYLTHLWREFLPHRPSMEHIDDHLEAGSEALDRGERDAALQHWIACWEALASAAPSAATAIELDGFLMSLRFADWLEVFAAEAEAVDDRHPLRAELARVLTAARAR